MITEQDLIDLENQINQRVKPYSTSFQLTFHFANERVNDIRNNPPISIEELSSIFERFINAHIMTVIALNDRDSFTIACSKTHIHIPCGVQKRVDTSNGGYSHKNIVITIMRKKDFKSKQDDIVLSID